MTDPPSRRSGSDDPASSLVIPTDAAYLGVLRRLVQTFAWRSGLRMDGVDDLRLAVDEAAAVLMEHAGPAQPLSVTVYDDEDDLYVRFEVAIAPDVERALSPESAVLLESTTDSYVIEDDGDRLIAVLQRGRRTS